MPRHKPSFANDKKMAKITLLQAALDLYNQGTQEGMMRSALLTKFAQTNPVLPYLTFNNIDVGVKQEWASLKSFSESEYVNLDENSSPGGTENYVTESVNLFKLSDKTYIPQTYVDQGMRGSLDERSQVMMMRMSATFTRTFFQGDNATQPKEMNGIRSLIGSSTTQLISAGSTSGGDALSLLKLDELIDAVSPIYPGETVVLYTNEIMMRLLNAAARTASIHNINYTMNEFGQRITTYNNIPLVPVYSSATGTAILPFTEANPGGGTAASTSIYAVKYGELGLSGIQGSRGMKYESFEDPANDVIIQRVSWLHNIVAKSNNCIARLQGIKNATVTL
jgi:hypothetical protein